MEKTASYQQLLIDEVKELPEEILPNLIQIVRLFKESLLLQSYKNLKKEFEEFEQLSDEALMEFEEGL